MGRQGLPRIQTAQHSTHDTTAAVSRTRKGLPRTHTHARTHARTHTPTPTPTPTPAHTHAQHAHKHAHTLSAHTWTHLQHDDREVPHQPNDVLQRRCCSCRHLAGCCRASPAAAPPQRGGTTTAIREDGEGRAVVTELCAGPGPGLARALWRVGRPRVRPSHCLLRCPPRTSCSSARTGRWWTPCP